MTDKEHIEEVAALFRKREFLQRHLRKVTDQIYAALFPAPPKMVPVDEIKPQHVTVPPYPSSPEATEPWPQGLGDC